MICWSCAAPRAGRQADDLQHRGELDRHVERGAPRREGAPPGRRRAPARPTVATWLQRPVATASSPGIARTIARPTRTTTFVQGDIEAVLTTARMPSAARASVITRWTSPNLMASPGRRRARGLPSKGPRSRDRFNQGEVTKHGIGAGRSAIGAREAAGVGLDRHRVSPLQMGDGAFAEARSRDPPLEDQIPVVPRGLRPEHVEREGHVGARLAGALAHDELPDCGALSPVNVAPVLAVVASSSIREKSSPCPCPMMPSPPAVRQRRDCGRLHRIDGRVDDELPVGRHFARLLEEAEGKRVAIRKPTWRSLPRLVRCPAVGGDLRRVRTDLEEESSACRRAVRREGLPLRWHTRGRGSCD